METGRERKGKEEIGEKDDGEQEGNMTCASKREKGRMMMGGEREKPWKKRDEDDVGKEERTERRKRVKRVKGVGTASGKIKESSVGNPERGSGLTEAFADVY